MTGDKVQLYTRIYECCGCTACYSICPKSAIEMRESVKGCSIPVIDENKCIGCQRCINVCSFKKFAPAISSPKAYIFRLENENELIKSQSGGVAHALALKIISLGGVVFGAELTENLQVEHKQETTIEGINRFRGSKYVQSNLGTSFSDCRKLLIEGKYVLFTGTPCQTHGLLGFLNATMTPVDKLYTMDIICRGVPGHGVWQRYINGMQKKHKQRITSVVFRDKEKSGWRGQIEKYGFEDAHVEYHNFWARASQRAIFYRESCYNCSYTTVNRESDFTVGDYWGVEKYYPEYNDNKGVSIVFTHSEKAEMMLGELVDGTVVEVPVGYALQPNLMKATPKRILSKLYVVLSEISIDLAVRIMVLPSVCTKVIFPLLHNIKTIRQRH